MAKFFLWLHNRSPNTKAFWQGALAIILFTLGAAAEHEIQRVFEDKAEEQLRGILWWMGMFLAALIWAAIQRAYLEALNKQARQGSRQSLVFQRARERLVELNHRQLIKCDSLSTGTLPATASTIREILICDQSRLARIIEAFWDIVDTEHNVSNLETERLNFEVTLITKSRRDDHLTIAAWKNRDMVTPKSLVYRNDKGDVTIFNKTIAARLMRDGAPATKVIPDTTAAEEAYADLYDGQKQRIRSSIVHLIMSPNNHALGALVLHCEQTGFFRKEDHRYWKEFFSIFAPAIALELERIDAYNRAALAWPESVEEYRPF